MHICFTSDFHGSLDQYERLGALLRAEQPDVLILGGDMFADGDEADPPGSQAAAARELLTAQIDIWKHTVPGVLVACVMGNHDWLRTEAAVRGIEDTGRLRLLDPRRPWSCGGLDFLGFYLTPPTPHWLKDYERLDGVDDPVPEFGGDLRATQDGEASPVDAESWFRGRPALEEVLAELAPPPAPWVFVCHAPPFDTKLDRLPGVGPIGSRAVRRYIERHRPLCALHGHVHESPEVTGAFADEVGGVVCINPGQSHEALHAVLFDSDRVRETLRHTVLS